MSLPVIVQTVKRHLEDLVGLTQAVPGSIVTLVHFNSVSEFISQQENLSKCHVDMMCAINTPTATS